MVHAKTKTTQQIPISKIQIIDCPVNEDLINSLTLVHQKTPVVLVALTDGTYKIKDGRRRVFSLNYLKVKTVTAFVEQPDKKEADFHVDALLYNSGIPNTGDECRHVQHLIDECQYTLAEVSEVTAMSLYVIKNRYKIATELNPGFLEELVDGEISLAICNDLLRLDKVDQETIWERYISDTSIGYNELKKLIKQTFTDTKVQPNIDALTMAISAPVSPPVVIAYHNLTETEDGYLTRIEYDGLFYDVVLSEVK